MERHPEASAPFTMVSGARKLREFSRLAAPGYETV
jgi:hypothetical protein